MRSCERLLTDGKARRNLFRNVMNSTGTIRIDRFEVVPRPAVHAGIDALRRKLRLLRAYRNTPTVLARGLKLLATGTKLSALVTELPVHVPHLSIVPPSQ